MQAVHENLTCMFSSLPDRIAKNQINHRTIIETKLLFFQAENGLLS